MSTSEFFLKENIYDHFRRANINRALYDTCYRLYMALTKEGLPLPDRLVTDYKQGVIAGWGIIDIMIEEDTLILPRLNMVTPISCMIFYPIGIRHYFKEELPLILISAIKCQKHGVSF